MKQISWNHTNLQIWFIHLFIYLWPVISVIKREVLITQGFPGGPVICLQCRRPGSDPWVGKVLWRKEWQPAPVEMVRAVPLWVSWPTSVLGEGWHSSPAHKPPDLRWEGSGICAGSPCKYLVTFKYSSDCHVQLWKNIQVMDCNKCACWWGCW